METLQALLEHELRLCGLSDWLQDMILTDQETFKILSFCFRLAALQSCWVSTVKLQLKYITASQRWNSAFERSNKNADQQKMQITVK